MSSRALEGRIVLISGASAGIGRATAIASAAAGATVVAAARRRDRLDTLVTEIEATGGTAIAVEADVVHAGQMAAVVDHTLDRFGRLDVSICNAGIGYHGPFETTPDEVVDRLIAVNLAGTITLARASLAVMRRQGTGHLIVVSSIVGRRGVGGSAVYSATKAAQVALVESIRAECAGTKIRASAIYPVSTETEFHQAIARDFGQRVTGLGPRQSADSVAQSIVRCMVKPVPEVYPYRFAKLLAVVNVIAPGIADRLVQKYRRDGHDVAVR